MRLPNTFSFRNKSRQKSQSFKIIVCLLFIFIISLNFLYINNANDKIELSDQINSKNDNNTFNGSNDNLETSSATSMLLDPFTMNFDQLIDLFETNYQSSLDYEIPTYFRYGDSNGVVIPSEDKIYSEDNLLYYNSLLKMELNGQDTFSNYLDLKDTNLWYDGNSNNYKYGFVRSIHNDTGEVYEDERYLTDNVLPIFLLIENIGDDIKTISVDGETPIIAINEIFNLLNSSEFWDDVYYGFYDYNSSISIETNVKYTESNFYAILVNLLIHRTYYDLGLNEEIRDRALELANLTMNEIYNKMWGGSGGAFKHHAAETWAGGDNNPAYYHLSTNALGIIAMLEYWLVSGMENDSKYLKRAKELYNNLNTNLYNSTYRLYENVAQPSWDISDNNINLDSNAMMMRACLKLFEVSGNITYYDRAVNISESIESNLYEDVIGAYNFSIFDNDKSFNANIKLSKAYLDAFDIYNATVLNCVYDVSQEVPDFIFNQDVMNLTTVYSFIKTDYFFNPSPGNKTYNPFTVKYDIPNATVNYIFKDPNETFLERFTHQINKTTSSHSLIYPILDTLSIADGYYIYAWVNSSYFRLTDTLKRFNVMSGVFNISIEGLVSKLIQGSVVNVSLFIDYVREDDLTLTASLEGDQLLQYPSQDINFVSNEETQIDYNLAAKPSATPGDSEIFFRIKKDGIVYLEIKKVIEIGYPFEYSNLIYQGNVVSGDSISVSMNLKNFLPDVKQTLNVSFAGFGGDFIEDFIQEETLNGNEIKSVSYSLKSLDNIYNETFRIKMSISIQDTIFYTESFAIKTFPKFELISVSFAEKVPQGYPAYFILIIKNNQENSEEFSLYLNGKRISTSIDELDSGENRIEAKVTPSINPYEFGTKNFRFVLKDSSDDEIERFYFEISLELSTLNLVLFYILPIIVPIGLILFFKNRDIKHKKLTR